MAKSKTYTAKDLIKRLRARYEVDLIPKKKSHGRHVLLEQVASGTGWQNEGWVDAIVIDMWPSDGLTRRAFEVKVSRADFLNELGNHKKNQWARGYCHEFWYVAPKDVIKEEELPEGDGWLCPHGDKLSIVRHAVRREPVLDDSFVAALARSMAKEHNKNMTEMSEKIRQEDPKYREAEAYRNATKKFISEHHRYWVVGEDDREKSIYDLLSNCGVEERMAQEVRLLENNLSSFQESMLSLWDVVTMMAFVGISESDKQGKFVMRYLGDDTRLLALRRARDSKWYKANGGRKYTKDADNNIRTSWDVMVGRAKALLENLK